MIRQVINVNNYWKVIVYYDIDYNLFRYVANDLSTSPLERINAIRSALETGAAKAFTLSTFTKRTSVVGFNKHKNKYDYINSVVHEAEHVKQDMLRYYRVKDKGEPPAYTIGFLVQEMMKVLQLII